MNFDLLLEAAVNARAELSKFENFCETSNWKEAYSCTNDLIAELCRMKEKAESYTENG